jgi:hypothetical protein
MSMRWVGRGWLGDRPLIGILRFQVVLTLGGGMIKWKIRQDLESVLYMNFVITGSLRSACSSLASSRDMHRR